MRALGLVVLTSTALLGACALDLGPVPCAGDGDCPAGQACRQGVCAEVTGTGGGGGGALDGGGGGGGTVDAGVDAGTVEGAPGTCFDGVDNDGDGETDCEDADCASQVCRATAGACDLEELCAGGACPADERAPPDTLCRAATDGGCDAPERCDGTSAACPADAFAAMGTSCRDAAGPCDAPEACTGTSPACPADGFEPTTTQCRPAAGACDLPDFCSGTTPTCDTNVFRASTEECRPSTGTCDPAERCTGSSPSCPANALEPAATVCRAAAGPCDTTEVCDGQGAACPPNTFAGQGTVCRPAVLGGCDVAETCTGDGASCPTDAFAPSSVVCRPSAGDCDVADRCTGVTAACPDDQLASASVVCRASTGSCDAAEACTGSSATCPVNVSTCGAGQYCDGTNGCQPQRVLGSACTLGTQCGSGFCADGRCCNSACDGACDACNTAGLCLPVANTVVCRPSAGPCDVAENCNGTATSCPADALRDTNTVCRQSAGACDPAEQCTGTAASCPPDTLHGGATICRPSGGVCDPAEVCSGSAPTCPNNQLTPLGTVCRASAGACDVAESCSGSSATCPNDAFQPPMTSCGLPLCVNGTYTPGSQCLGGSNTCQSYSPVSCGGYQCNASGTACLAACGANGDCLSTHYCQNMACVTKLADGANCVNPTDCVSGTCLQGYVDDDLDGYGDPARGAKFCGSLPTSPTRYVANNTDCCDANANVRPNQTSYFTVAIPSPCSSRGFDYNCSGVSERQYTVVNGCSAGTCSTNNCTGSGWTGTTAASCGTSANYSTCTTSNLICSGGQLMIACNTPSIAARFSPCR